MRALLGKARTRLGVAVVGASLLAVGGTATAAVVATSPASDSSVVEPTTSDPTTSDPTSVTTEPATVTLAPTVDAVTPPPTPQPTPTPAPASAAAPAAPTAAVKRADAAPYDPEARFTDQAGNTYQPAPEVPVEPLPGEPRYTAPNGAPGAPPADPS